MAGRCAQRGVSAAEYAVIASLIAAMIVSFVWALSDQVVGFFERLDLS